MAFLRLLLIERDPDRAAGLLTSLSSDNLEVVTVATEEEAKSALVLRHFDVVLLTSTLDNVEAHAFESFERTGPAPVFVVWGDSSDAGEAFTIPATVSEQNLAAEIFRLYESADLRRDTAADALPVFDLLEFRSQMGGDEALIREIVGLFFEDSFGQLEAIRTLLETGDTQSASRLAHSLKGALGSLRAARGHHCAAILEKAAAAGDAPRSKRAFGALESAMDELALELRSTVGS